MKREAIIKISQILKKLVRAKDALRFGMWTATLIVIVFSAAVHIMPVENTFDYPIRIISALRVGRDFETPYSEVNFAYGPLSNYILGFFMALVPLSPVRAAQLFFLDYFRSGSLSVHQDIDFP